MIPHFRDPRFLQVEINENITAATDTSDECDEITTEEERDLELLMKHAVRSTNYLEHDPKQVWQRLSERVRGPFGRMAVEEPANMGSTEMPMPSEYEKADTHESVSGARSHSLYRLANEAYSMR